MDAKIFLFLWIFVTIQLSVSAQQCSYYYNGDTYSCYVDTSLNSSTNEKHLDNRNDNAVTGLAYKNSFTKVYNFCKRFKNLEYFAYSDEKSQSINSNVVQGCNKLTFLSFTIGNLKQVPENILNDNLKLKTFLLEQSLISTLQENIFINQKDLEDLFLYTNKISSLPSNIFKSQTNVKRLLLQENRIRILNPNWFGNLKNLKFLDLDDNQIFEVPENIFQSLVSLEDLHLSRNKIKTLHSNSFFNLNRPTHLRLSSNQISFLPQNLFNFMRNLGELWIDGNQLTVIHANSFSTHRNLTKISLSNNSINAIDESFIEITAVSYFDMTNNVCSNENITRKHEVKQKIRECFENYKHQYDQNKKIQINVKSTDTCGKSMIGYGNIIGGAFVTRGAFPWIAALVRNSGHFFCGGTLISDRKVITAAHCMQEKHQKERILESAFVVLLGVHDLKNSFEVGRVSMAVQDIHMNPKWNINIRSYDADIAVLILERKVIFDNLIQPICLIDPNSEISKIDKGVVVGFGQSEDETKKHENIPKILDIPIHDNEDCFLKNPDLAIISSKRSFCGGYGNGSGVCRGDSGSGVVIRVGTAHYLRGIVSSSLYTGTYECDVYTYSVFTNMLKFYDWLNEIDESSQLYDRK